MNNLFKTAVALMLATVLSIATAQAGMTVDRMVVTFLPDGSKNEDIQVTNRGNEVLFVEVTPEMVTDSALPTEQRTVIRNPVEAGLLVSPRRIRLEPGDTQVVRLVRMRQFNEERVFRVDLKPVVGELQAEQSGVKILVGYNLIVFAAPQVMNVALDATREGKTLVLSNTGNVNIEFRDLFQCDDAQLLQQARQQPDRCVTVTTKRLYPGRTQSVELPYNTPVLMRHYAGGEYQTLTVQ